MQSNTIQDETKRQKGSLADWGGLGYEPRNDNLAKIRGLGSFEKKENARIKEGGFMKLGRSDGLKNR